MHSILELFKVEQRKIAEDLNSNGFRPGDTVAVHDPSAKSSKPFVGLCIRKSSETALIRKAVGGYAVERIFPLYFNFKFEKIDSYKVRRARLYYLRNLTGKSARLKKKSQKKGSGV